MFAYLLSITRLERSVLLYVASFSAVGFGVMGVTGVLGNLYVLGLGFDTAYLGTLTASGQLIWALTALPAGAIGARFGLRGAVIAGYGLFSLFNLAYLNVPLLPREAWGAGLMITNLLVWTSVSLVSVNGVPYLMAVAPENERSKAFTLQTALLPVAAFLGSLAAGFLPGYLVQSSGGRLDEISAYRAALMLPALAFFGSALLMFRARPAPALNQTSADAARQAAPLGLLAFLGVLFGVQIASENGVIFFLNVYFSRDLLVSTSLIGTVFAVVRLLPFFISPLLPLALNRWGSGFTLASSSVLMGISALAMAFFQHWAAAGLAFVLASLASSIAMPARSLFGQESVQPRWRTTVNAVTTISLAVGVGLAGYGGGLLIELNGFRGLFLVSAGFAVAGVMMYAAYRKLAG